MPGNEEEWLVDAGPHANPLQMQRGWLTPHKIVLALIAKICALEETTDIDVFVFLVNILSQHNTWIEPTFVEFLEQIEKECPDSFSKMEKAIVRDVKKITCSLDHLVMFIQSTIRPLLFGQNEIKQAPVDPDSIVGLFLRKIFFYFDKVMFDGLGDLFNQFCRYFPSQKGSSSLLLSHNSSLSLTTASFQFQEESSEDLTNMGEESMEETMEEEEEGSSLLGEGNFNFPTTTTPPPPTTENQLLATMGSEDLDRCLTTQTAQAILSMGFTHPEAILKRIKDLHCEKMAAHPPCAFLIQCLASLFLVDPLGAVDNSQSQFNHRIELVDPVTGKPSHRLLSFASLDLARLHLYFGHSSLALQSLTEALHIAQESNDIPCLAFAVSWLLHMEWSGQGGGARGMDKEDMQEHLLKRSVDLSRELGLNELVIKNALFAVQEILSDYRVKSSSGDLFGTHPTQPSALESNGGEGGGGKQRPFARLWSWLNFAATISWDHNILVPSVECHLARSASWKVCGQNDIAGLHSVAPLCHSSDYATPISVCIGLCNLARLSFEKGDLETMEATMAALMEQYPFMVVLGVHAPILSQLLSLHFDQFMVAGNLEAGRDACEAARGLFSMYQAERKLSFERSSYLRSTSQLLREKGELRQSNDLLQSLLGNCSSVPSSPSSFVLACAGEVGPFQAMELLLSACENFLAAQSPIGALPYALTCLSLCQTYHSRTTQITATIFLCQICLGLGQVSSAWSLLEDLRKLVVGQSSVLLQGDYYFVVAKVALALENERKKREGGGKEERGGGKAMECVCCSLEKAIKFFVQVEANKRLVEVYHLQAVVYNIRGMKGERNLASRRFREVMMRE